MPSAEKRADHAVSRRKGMGEAERATMKAFNEAQPDWTAVCRHCGTVLQGTLEKLRAHTCGGTHGKGSE